MPPAPGPDLHLDKPRVTILLATYNGARHLNEQLASYCTQRDVHWDLWVSDDGSTDDTLDIIAAFKRDQGDIRDIRVLEGPRQGFASNFMALLTHPELPTNCPVALSDQDDVWHPDKLARAMDALHTSGPVTLYSGQSYHTDAALNMIGQSRIPACPPSFRNALVQNVVSGHSIVMTPGALALVRAAGMPASIPYHDWWLYQLISGAGGRVYVDTARMIHYRQHTNNTMGAHDGLHASLTRISHVLGHTYGDWINANLTSLMRVHTLLTPENNHLLKEFTTTPKGFARAMALKRLGLHRQTRAATASLYLAAALGRI